MRTASIDEAHRILRELVEAARLGESVLITDDGTAVAELQPAHSSQHPPEHGDLNMAIRVGTSPPPKLERFPSGSIPSGVLDALLEERREGW